MSIKFTDIDTFDIYVLKERIKDLDLNNKNVLETYLKSLFMIVLIPHMMKKN